MQREVWMPVTGTDTHPTAPGVPVPVGLRDRQETTWEEEIHRAGLGVTIVLTHQFKY